jgi:hypothetical protein
MSTSEPATTSDVSALEPVLARLVAESEAISSSEGTREINLLIIGLSITGESAFVGE